ncbi:scavenger receptor cysteine-rich type 1 protein M130-like [Indicator indicator]|uniref:scavenger receptor cysteine-rich type 1 protein M130-like n=1 Tax=Indicator indicator TaxID=1002788 RepID=UPI0023E00F8C|nr:scavenger receptor cysteine-rich type 1 protein M130-like [Indicator indicator]
MVPILGLLLCGVQLCGGTGELRLVDGGGRCAGRVEVKHDGEWGSVCSYDFDWDARWARVVCQQLGCGPVLHSSPYAPFGQGTGRIWLQPFFCRGSEEVLEECPHFGWGKHFCGHELDVGVTCAEAVELRLAAGTGPCAGRVEAKLRGRWGTVADPNWDIREAEVVCQQLGCGSAAGAYAAAARFGKGDGAISLVLVTCNGHEATLWDCEIRGWGPYAGIHDFDTAVVCQGFARLVGGEGGCAGQLEVRRGQTWAGVCEDQVDVEAAQVVCRELGCGAALAVTGTGRLEAGTGPLWGGEFECAGTEPLLAACARRPPGSQSCAGHAVIVCSSYTGFRLVGNTSSCTGRVEAEVGGTWRSLCASGWDLPDAHVLCHHLGCGPAVAVPPGGSFGREDGLLWRDTFSCHGNEWHLGECPVTVLGKPTCSPGHAATVNCSGDAKPLRLVDGQSRCDGRLEVATSSSGRSRVPAGLWDARGASVVCRQLDCGVPEKVYAVPSLGKVGLRGLWCDGTEENLALCNVSGAATVATSSPEEVAVVCSGSRRVRLAAGPGRCAGRVEVYVNGTWGTVCLDRWDLPDATVVCRQLGCGTALEAPSSARFGPGTGPLWLGAGGCAGTELSLWDCPALARRGCRRGGGAAAVCSEQLSLRLVGSRCKGHLEVLHEGIWGRVCANGTSPATATTVCRHLGCGDSGWLAAAPTLDPAPAWLAWVGCEQGTRSLWRCPSAPWHLQPCSPDGDAHVTCDQDTDDKSEMPTLAPGSSTRAETPTPTASTLPVAAILCVVLGMLLCLALAALVVQRCRAQAWCQGGATDAISDAIYEELDYTLTPEYQEVPSLLGSLSEGSGTKLPCDSGDGMEEESDPMAAPAPPAQHGPPDGYDDAMADHAGDISEEVAQRSWDRGPPTEATVDPPEEPPGDTDYDDVGISTPGPSL